MLRLHHAAAASLVLSTLMLVGCSGDGQAVPDADTDLDAGTGDFVVAAEALRASLSAAMAGHRVRPYAEAWTVLAEGATVAPGEIRLFYTRRVIPAANRASGENQAEPDYWNREHLWPQSYGLASNAARTDLHNLVPVDRTVNSARGNKWFDELTIAHAECTRCAVSSAAWEPPAEAKGDVARIAFYMDVRYEGEGADGVPDLSLGDSPAPALARFGRLSALARWHCEDPVSAEELRRHEAAAAAQGNRNAFVDAPELAGTVYGFTCDGIPLVRYIGGQSAVACRLGEAFRSRRRGRCRPTRPRAGPSA